MKNYKNKKINNFAKNFNPKNLEKQVEDITKMLQELDSLDLTQKPKIFEKRADIIKKKALSLEKQIKKEYKDILPIENLDSKK